MVELWLDVAALHSGAIKLIGTPSVLVFNSREGGYETSFAEFFAKQRSN